MFPNNIMPALRVLGQRLRFTASDDLRGLAKVVLFWRLGQALILVPSILLLIRAGDEIRFHYDTVQSAECRRDQQVKTTVVWSFCILSMITIVSSIVLETCM
jgi:hypothetical protein